LKLTILLLVCFVPNKTLIVSKSKFSKFCSRTWQGLWLMGDRHSPVRTFARMKYGLLPQGRTNVHTAINGNFALR